MTLAVGYVRVSSDEQGASGLSLEAQRRALEEEASRRGWELQSIFEDIQSGRSGRRRSGLSAALEAAGHADVLVAVSIDRLSRSVGDLSAILDASLGQGWSLVTLDLRVDTTTPHGRAFAQLAGVFAELERGLIASRTRAALAVKKAQGVKLGRPQSMPPEVRRRIKRMRSRGMGWTEIASKLNKDSVPTAQGGKCWYPSTVRAMFVPR
jgi:DNA invertase Pin-like site-specific DNA recombinase